MEIKKILIIHNYFGMKNYLSFLRPTFAGTRCWSLEMGNTAKLLEY